MENNDFETILTVKEFDSCCTFYLGLLSDLKICVAASFMMKFKLPDGKFLRICAPDVLAEDFVQTSTTLNLQLGSADIGHAIEYLLQHDLKFVTEKNIIRTADPAGNTITLSSDVQHELNPVRRDSRTRKLNIS